MLRLFVVTTQTQLSAPTVPPRSDSISRAAPSDRNKGSQARDLQCNARIDHQKTFIVSPINETSSSNSSSKTIHETQLL